MRAPHSRGGYQRGERSRSSAHAWARGRALWAGAQARVARAWPPLLPHRWEMQRLRQQDLAELAAVHGAGWTGIERPPQALLRDLIPGADDTCGDLPCRAGLRRTELQHLRPSASGADLTL